MITRKEYMASTTGKSDEERTALHRAYYAQFVTDAVKRLVVLHIGAERIANSTDPHFNDIPLAHWDALNGLMHMHCAQVAAKVEGGWSLATAVCVAKEAAKQIKESA